MKPGKRRQQTDSAREPEWCPTAEQGRKGRILGNRYRIVRKIGEGGMGEVYEAVHLSLGRRVAIKLLHAANRARTSYVERFSREARSLASVCSEHVVFVTDSGESDDGLPFIVMEYLDGSDLRQVLKHHTVLPPLRAVRIVSQACEGVGVAHAQGLVHRDLKPENLFLATRVGGSECCKVLDFGVAKHRDAGTLTRDGALVGTTQYMAPEQVLGNKHLDGRVDVFALGCILYECLAGESAFQGDKAEAILYAILHRDPTPLGKLNPEVPRLLEHVVHRALARDPSDRFRDITEFLAALRCIEQRLRTKLPDAGASTESGDAAESTRADTGSDVSLRPLSIGKPPDANHPTRLRWAKASRMGAVAALGLVAGVFLASLVFAASRTAPQLAETASEVPGAQGAAVTREAHIAVQPAKPAKPSNDPNLEAARVLSSRNGIAPTNSAPMVREQRRPPQPVRKSSHAALPLPAGNGPKFEQTGSLDLAPNPYRRSDLEVAVQPPTAKR